MSFINPVSEKEEGQRALHSPLLHAAVPSFPHPVGKEEAGIPEAPEQVVGASAQRVHRCHTSSIDGPKIPLSCRKGV